MNLDHGTRYRSTLTSERADELRAWHESSYEDIRARLPMDLAYLGLDLHVPKDVFPPAAETFHRQVVEEVTPSDRVLDMGTGCGVCAILAAKTSRDVVGVDVNPRAV